MRRLLLLLIVPLTLAVSACGSDDDETAAPNTPQTTTATADNPPVGANGCQQISSPPAPKPEGHAKQPRAPLDDSKTWTLEFRTSCGLFTVTLDPKSAPHATASMVSLAKAGFFDDTIFHRIIPGFVIQGGDPTATSQGGPGYSTVDPPPRAARYTKGVVAMAKAPNEKPGTAGSQFYVVTGADAGLPPDYAIIGKVTSGMTTVDRIGKLGDSQTEQPTQVVVLYEVKAAGR